jgi:hypothetical protein
MAHCVFGRLDRDGGLSLLFQIRSSVVSEPFTLGFPGGSLE